MKLRLDERGYYKDRAAEALGVKGHIFYRLIANPESNATVRIPDVHELIIFARILGVSIEEALFRFGFVDNFAQGPKVPVVGKIDALGAITPLPHSERIYVDSPVASASTIAAIVANTRDTPAARFDGATFFYDTLHMNALGVETRRRLSVIEFTGKRPNLLGYYSPLPNGFCSVSPFSDAKAEIIERIAIKAAARVEWVRNL